MLTHVLFLAMITSSFEVVQARTIFNAGNPDAKRLYDDLLSNYNKLVRPVVNTTDSLTVRIKLKLSQLIDVVSSNLKAFNIHSELTLRSITKPALYIILCIWVTI